MDHFGLAETYLAEDTLDIHGDNGLVLDNQYLPPIS